MDGIFYLFFLWSIWIIATFLLEKQQFYRLPMAAGALLLLILFPVHLSLKFMLMSGSTIIILFIGYYFLSKLPWKQKLYVSGAILSLSIGYSGFRLFEIYDPIWVFIDRKSFFCFFLFFFAYFMYPSSLSLRLLFICLGVLHGEIFFAILLSHWGMVHMVGAKECLDILAITCSLLLIFQAIVHLVSFSTQINRKKLQQ
ncbi:hypothetical protein [Bacillus sp. FJAT-50079]|uniref:YphA family membrane protein n=1 Tax=Bacillus sp. FJAT-50079 TaxID=2833577 RepID=UPI001BCA0884|nr:hypothetical protein [Bacillus sp. FJAT-50079]MBS4209755.1 hypothetical protein [Bacillus sp. FJAT-50079]